MIKSFLGALFFMNFFLISAQASSLDSIDVYSLITEKQRIDIAENFEVTHTVERKFTILSAEGLGHAFTSISYDKLIKIEDFQLEIVNLQTGKSIKKARLKDMTDVAIYSTMSVFDDNRRKYYEVESGVFPVEVIINFKTKSVSNYFLPRWVPVHYYNQKVVESTLEVSYPKSVGLRFKEQNLLGEKKQDELDGMVTLTWVEKDLPIQEPDLEDEDDHRLLLAPVNFAVENYSGQMNDWSGMAAWLYKLNEGRDQLPQDLKNKIHQLTDGIEDKYQKIQVLYSYLQQNYRYVSIQLGIGGWQTMTAEDVAKYSYGDCKGLTNLMKSMLAEAGIDSNYTLVYAGENEDDIEVEFPSNQFNHVILQVPDEVSPIWLECTSNLLPAGYLGPFTKNRHVLVTTPDGGYLTKTPAYNDSMWNNSVTSSEIKIDSRGDASIQTKLDLKGNFAEEITYIKNNQDLRKQKDYFNKNSPVSGLIINEFSLDLEHLDSLPVAKVQYDGYIQKFVQSTNKRVILKSFLGPIDKGMLSNNRLVKTDTYSIALQEELEWEGNLVPLLLEEENFKILIDRKLEAGILTVKREVDITLPEEIEEEDKTALLKKINSLSNSPYIFLKPEKIATQQ